MNANAAEYLRLNPVMQPDEYSHDGEREVQRRMNTIQADESTVLTFGKYRGKSIGEVMARNPQYLSWAVGESIIALPESLLTSIEREVDEQQRDRDEAAGYDGNWWDLR